MFLLSTSFFRLSFVFVFVVVSFYSPSLVRLLQREQQQRATAPVQSEEGKGALIN
jgi:hypothetical protein|tara:strand:+ start:1644 stop:1808 length:165 start_codon:yes stop_codon:yes gene_type:complete